MSQHDQNFAYLCKRYLQDRSARKALNNFNSRGNQWLKDTLRHHDDEEITDKETWWRDEFDFLLSFYGICEIACMAGFISGPVDTEFSDKHLEILSHEAVKRYYERHYPIALPGKFRARLARGSFGKSIGNASAISSFYAFLEITRVIEEDPEVEQFLWMLDGGSRYDERLERWTDLDSLLKIMKDLNSVTEYMIPRGRARGVMGKAVRGLGGFIGFCRRFSELIEVSDSNRDLVFAFWQFHEYWFREFNYDVGSRASKVFRSMGRWAQIEGEEGVAALDNLLRNLAKGPPGVERLPRRRT